MSGLRQTEQTPWAAGWEPYGGFPAAMGPVEALEIVQRSDPAAVNPDGSIAVEYAAHEIAVACGAVSRPVLTIRTGEGARADVEVADWLLRAIRYYAAAQVREGVNPR
ncbi:MAG TPA: hypothetical protein VMY35_06420 [Phycisphaerae bacterium]|nr:hypothetical protein [Phycisphaerae bacterium]